MTGSLGYGAVNRGAEIIARWAAVALGFSIPVSVALDSLLALVILLACLLTIGYRGKSDAIRARPVSMSSCFFSI